MHTDVLSPPPTGWERRPFQPRPDDIVLNPVRLSVFCMVVECRGFTRAAEALSLTQSTVSDHIRVLEDAVGSPLFDRRKRGGQLTEVGAAVYDFAVAMQRELAALRAHVSDLMGGSGGGVTLGATMIPGTHVLPGLLVGFYRLHPTARLVMRLLPPDAICGEVLNGHLDFGVVSEAEPLSADLQAEPLWVDTLVVVATPHHHLVGEPSVSLGDLAGEPFVVAWGRTLGEQALDRALAGNGLPPRRIVMALGNQDGVKQAVLQDVGLAIVFHRVVAEDLASGRLARLPVADLPMCDRHLLVYRQAHRMTPIAAQLISFLRSEAPQLSD